MTFFQESDFIRPSSSIMVKFIGLVQRSRKGQSARRAPFVAVRVFALVFPAVAATFVPTALPAKQTAKQSISRATTRAKKDRTWYDDMKVTRKYVAYAIQKFEQTIILYSVGITNSLNAIIPSDRPSPPRVCLELSSRPPVCRPFFINKFKALRGLVIPIELLTF